MQLPLFDAYPEWPKNNHCAECAVWIVGVIDDLVQKRIVTLEDLKPPPHGGWPESAEARGRREMIERMWTL